MAAAIRVGGRLDTGLGTDAATRARAFSNRDAFALVAGSAGAAGAGDAGLLEGRGGNAEFAEGGVGDALARRVVSCDRDELRFQGLEIRQVLLTGKSVLEVEPSLDQLKPLDRVAFGVDLLLHTCSGVAVGRRPAGLAVVRALR
jgi:hypothetical protein